MHYTHRHMGPSKSIALVAHDHQKERLLDWATKHRTELAIHRLFATGTTGTLLSKQLDLKIETLLSGPMGGDQQLGAKIAEGKVELLIFFWDPLQPQPHDPDVKALLRLAAVWNIPVACNEASADFLFNSTLLTQHYECRVPDYHGYLEKRTN